MNCRKCGAKRITKRRAGVFSCLHCGVQPGPYRLERGGSPAIEPQQDSGALPPDESKAA